jgi:hypothetical protein
MGRMNSLTDEQLVEYSGEHLKYEVSMLAEADRVLQAMRGKQVLWVVNMALIESFAIHLRNLTGFLYPGAVRPGDVLAEDFVKDPSEWEARRGAIPQSIQDAK